MIISHPKVPEISDDWLRDENEITDIFLPIPRGVTSLMSGRLFTIISLIPE